MRRIFITRTFEQGLARLPRGIRERTNDRIDLLRKNPRHKSLGEKKIIGLKEIREVSIAPGYRATLEHIPEGAILRTVGKVGA